MRYEDFELLATAMQIDTTADAPRVSFQWQVTRSPVGELLGGVPADYNPRDAQELLKGWETRARTWTDVMQVGLWLGRVLFPGPVRELLVRSLERIQERQSALRIRLRLEEPLHQLPWEYALINRAGGEATVSDFLALMPDVSVVRHQAATVAPWPVRAGRPAQVVVALASPSDLPPLALDEEQDVIEQALAQSPDVHVTYVVNATPETLMGASKPVHLFHFAGHGDFREWPGTAETGERNEAGEGVILLEDPEGGSTALPARALALHLRQAGVRVAVLGACRSGRRDNVSAWSSVATALLKDGLGAVVGMQYTIRNNSARAFAGAFYRALAAGLPIDVAVSQGRLAMAQLDDARGWGVPVLYLRVGDGVVFPEYAGDPALETEREQRRLAVEQNIEVLRGRATGIALNVLEDGIASVQQKVKVVEQGATLIGYEGTEVKGGTVTTHQDLGTVEGDVAGIKLDQV